MTEIVLAAPVCTPHRNQITGTLHQYGITSARVRDGYTLLADGGTGPEGAYIVGSTVAVRQVYHVRVSERSAVWAEYVLLRTQQYELLSKPLDRRNIKWAARWNGAMPKPWRSQRCGAPAARPAGWRKVLQDLWRQL